MARLKSYHNVYEVELYLAKKEVQEFSPQTYTGSRCQIAMFPNDVIITTEDLTVYKYDKSDVKRIKINVRKVKNNVAKD